MKNLTKLCKALTIDAKMHKFPAILLYSATAIALLCGLTGCTLGQYAHTMPSPAAAHEIGFMFGLAAAQCQAVGIGISLMIDLIMHRASSKS